MKEENVNEKLRRYEEALQKVAHYPYYDYETRETREIAREALDDKYVKTEDDLD